MLVSKSKVFFALYLHAQSNRSTQRIVLVESCSEGFSKLKNSSLMRLKTGVFVSEMPPQTFVTSENLTHFCCRRNKKLSFCNELRSARIFGKKKVASKFG